MPTPNHTPEGDTVYERQLVFGGSGVGKSHWLWTIALWHKLAGSTSTFWWVDVDDAVTFARQEGSPFAKCDNVIRLPIAESGHDAWVDLMAASKKIRTDGSDGDWIMTDRASTLWTHAQDFFIGEIWGKELEDFWIDMRRKTKASDKSVKNMDGWKDWSVINKIYFQTANRLFKPPNMHVAATAEEKPVEDTDDERTINTYKHLGVKPAGQKDIPFTFHSTFRLTHNQLGQHQITTARERPGRDLLRAEDWKNAHSVYLKPIGRWT